MSSATTTPSSAAGLFTPEEIERARRYNRPLYTAGLAGSALALASLAILAFGSPGDELFELTDGWPWWLRSIAFSALILAILDALRLPLGFWAGHLREHAWGFSTQSMSGWLADRAKGLAIGLPLSVAPLVGLVATARLEPGAWPAVAAPAAAAIVLAIGFLAPVVLEPVFNRFRPVDDEQLASRLRALASRLGVPVRDVLVADASRRTRKVNAYVSGLGSTRRVVLYDTLLERAEPRELELVVAHELGHRRARHVLIGTLLAMTGAATFVLLVWAALPSPPGPRDLAFVLFLGSALELAAAPFGSALSRRFERQADRFSLEATGNAEVFERAHRDLAASNLADLDPPRLLYWLLFTHPTPPERIALARATSGPSGRASRAALAGPA